MLVALLVSLAVLLGAVEWLLRQQTTLTAAEYAYRQRVLYGSAPWVAVGDSHAANGLDSNEWLDNLGQASDNLDSILGKLTIRTERPGLKGVILSADPQMFAFYRLTADQGGRLRELREEHLSPLLFLRPQHRQYLASTALAIASDPAVLWRLPGTQALPKPPLPDSSKWDKEAVLRAQLHTPIRNIDRSPAALRYREAVKEIKKQDIEVCLVAFPLSSAYRRATNGAPTFVEARAFYLRVAIDTGARFVDATSFYPDSLFGDPDHLSPEGATQLTARLLRECALGGKP